MRLVIYNAIGQPVRTLVDRFREAGDHEVVWDAGDVASGVFDHYLGITWTLRDPWLSDGHTSRTFTGPAEMHLFRTRYSLTHVEQEMSIRVEADSSGVWRVVRWHDGPHGCEDEA